MTGGGGSELKGSRALLRPLRAGDFEAWRAVRQRSSGWLLKWEPKLPPGQPDPSRSPSAFAARCSARQREWQLGSGYGFGIFVSGRLAGDMGGDESRGDGSAEEGWRALLGRRVGFGRITHCGGKGKVTRRPAATPGRRPPR